MKVTIKYLKKFSPLIDQSLVSGGNFLTIAVSAHFLTLHEQGKLGLLYSIYLGIVILNLACVFQRASIDAPHSDDREGYKRSLVVLQGGMAVITVAVLLIILPLCNNFILFYDSVSEYTLSLLFLFLHQGVDFKRRSNYIFSEPISAMKSSLLVYPARILLLMTLSPSRYLDVIAISCLSLLVPTISFAFDSVCAFKSFNKAAMVKIVDHLKKSFELIILAPVAWLNSFVPLYALGVVAGNASVGILASIRNVTNFANVFMEQLETIVVSDFSKISAQGRTNLLHRKVVILLLVGSLFWALTLLGFIFFGEDLLRTILGGKYQSYSMVLNLMWISFGIYFVSRVFAIKYRSMKNVKVELIGNLATTLPLPLVAYYLASKYGIAGSCYTYIFVSLSILIWQWITIHHLHKRAVV